MRYHDVRAEETRWMMNSEVNEPLDPGHEPVTNR